MWPVANSDPSIAPLRSHQINSLCVTHSLLVRGFDLFSANNGQMLLVKKEFSDLITVDVNSWSTRLFICRDSNSSRSAKSFLASELGRILALSILRTWFLFVCAREMSRCRLMLSRCWKLPPNCHNVSHYICMSPMSKALRRKLSGLAPGCSKGCNVSRIPGQNTCEALRKKNLSCGALMVV